MKNFFRTLFDQKNQPHRTSAVSVPPRENRDNPLTIEDGSENATRRQLVQVLLRDVLRKSGIPSEWIECQMLLVSSRSRGRGMYIRLVITHWDARLLNYAFAFQQMLMSDIERFEPNAEEWLHGVSWQLDVEGQCPFTELPDKSFWEVAEKKVSKTAVHPRQAGQDSTPADKLHHAFAERDKQLEAQASQGLTPVGYEATQPAPL